MTLMIGCQSDISTTGASNKGLSIGMLGEICGECRVAHVADTAILELCLRSSQAIVIRSPIGPKVNHLWLSLY